MVIQEWRKYLIKDEGCNVIASRKGFIGKVILSRSLKEVRQQAMQTIGEKCFQGESRASTKVPCCECAWCFWGISRRPFGWCRVRRELSNWNQRVCRAQDLVGPVGNCKDFNFYSESDRSHWNILNRRLTWPGFCFKMITVVTVETRPGVGARAASGLGGYCKNISKRWWLSLGRRLQKWVITQSTFLVTFQFRWEEGLEWMIVLRAKIEKWE